MAARTLSKILAVSATILTIAGAPADADIASPAPERYGNKHLQLILDHWGAEVGDPRYSKKADFVLDRRIDNADLQFVLQHWNQPINPDR